MENNTIVQFVGFETNVEPDEFILNWEPYAKKFAKRRVEVTLEHQAGSTHKFRYLSQHKWRGTDFHFTFMKGRHSEHFPECPVKVVQAGGYIPIQLERLHEMDASEVKLIIFTRNAETDISAYRHLASQHGCMNIYQAYYESCLYTYIIELFIKEIHISEVLNLAKKKGTDTQIGIYTECRILNDQ